MIRTFALVFGLGAGLGAISYAHNLRGSEAMNFKNPRTLAGQVNADGSVSRGTHFTVVHRGTGNYELTFDEGYFANGCPVLTVTPLNSINTTFSVSQVRCNLYDAYFESAKGILTDTEFNLIAVAAK